MSFSNPFAASASRPGYGEIVISLLPPATPVLKTLSYQYPLKLIAPDAIPLPDARNTDAPTLIHTVFLLTYGGGLVAGDTVHLNVTLDPTTKLILLTQGSTKIFKTPSRDVVSGQRTNVDFTLNAALCYLPDPVQPFEQSAFEQVQVYNLKESQGSMCVCDWVCEGRSARGEKWSFYKYTSKNEVWSVTKEGKKRLLLRDNLILDESGKVASSLVDRMDGLGVFGTIIIRGPLFESLGKYFMDEFQLLPRIGGRKWDTGTEEEELSLEEVQRLARQKQEASDGLVWSAASIRGFVLVKFGAKEVEGAKIWISHMLKSEGSVERSFGERALHCLK
ncbi:UreD-domain-containing protein [Glonium stellatum]|uniref:UreD-domain-containing protein n=1 Tax=Glonium stellatum TaxID=574774 RepID=A0A8E2JP56_9PEZI|nr:UreD-domain-containing protein [Glonium stellatum]